MTTCFSGIMMEPILWDAELQTGPANCKGCLCICTKEHTGICNLPTREKPNASWARIANAMKDTKLSPRMVRWSKFEEDDAWICPSHSPPAAPNRAVGEAHSRYVHSQRQWDFVVPSAPALTPVHGAISVAVIILTRVASTSPNTHWTHIPW
jgi:hypothetical protein